MQFKTDDLTLATYLIVKGFQNVGIDRMNEKKVFFLFDKTLGLEREIQNYWNSDGLVEPYNFIKEIHRIKARIKNYD